MNASSPNPAELPATQEAPQASPALMAGLNAAFVLEPLLVHEPTLAPVMKNILQFWPTSHWGIND
jgi:hypothetical protein